jgi:hypothetical protein
MQDPNTLPSREELLATVDKLNYHQRIHYAAQLGKTHKNSPKLKELIDNLRKHPDPPAPVMETEDEFTEMLPPQKKNTAKHYHEDQLALTAAASSKTNLDVLKNELQGPSIFFKRLTIKEVVKQEKSDEVLKKEIMSAVPHVRRKLLHACISERRTAVVQQLYPELIKLGIEFVMDVMHGCTKDQIRELLKDSRVMSSKRGVCWGLVARYHGDILLARMEDELKACKPLKRANLWQRWAGFLNRDDAISELLHHAEVAKHIYFHFQKYPPCTVKAEATTSYDDEDDVPAEHWDIQLPDLITKHLAYFVSRFEKEHIDLMVQHFVEIKHHSANSSSYGYGSSYGYTTITQPHDYLQLPKVVSFESFRRLYLEFYSQTEPLSFTDQWSSLVTSVADAIQQNYGWDKYATFVDDVCKTLLALSSESLHKDKKQNFYYAKWNSIISLVRTLVKYYSTIEERVNKKKMKREAADAKYLLLDEHQVTLLKKLWQEFTKLETYQTASNAREFFNAVNYLPKTTSLALELVWPVTAKRPDFHSYVVPSELVYLADTVATLWTSYLDPEKLTERRKTMAAIFESYARKFIALVKEKKMDAQSLLNFFTNIPQELRWELYQGYPKEVIETMAKNDLSTIVSIIKTLPKDRIFEAIKVLLADKLLNKTQRESLYEIMDIEDKEVRKMLQKAADSNNAEDRKSAIVELVKCTLFSGSVTQMTRTLNFIKKKLKNENSEMRGHGLQTLVSYANDWKNTWLKDGTGEEQFNVWLDLLKDTLEAPDLDKDTTFSEFVNHPLLSKFSQLSFAAIAKGAGTDDALFNFGVELQWRVIVFRKGEKRAAEEFRVNMHNLSTGLNEMKAKMKKNPEIVNKFVQQFYKAYEDRIKVTKPNWRSDLSYSLVLFDVLHKQWLSIPELVQIFTQLLEDIKKLPKDRDGLAILESDHNVISVGNTLLGVTKNWFEVPLLAEYVELVLKSRQAPRMLYRYMTKVNEKAKTRAEKIANREALVLKLLAISPSAIHIKFVWRYLVTRRQDLLDKYLTADAFRGVFYISAEERNKGPALVNRKAQRSARGRGARGGRGRAVDKRRGRGGKSRLSRAPNRNNKKESKALTREQDAIQEEEQQDDMMKLDMVDGDHTDLFILTCCYGLMRLLPRQTLVLDKQLFAKLLNVNRSIPERVQAAIRWTLLPTTTYADVVRALETYEKATEVDGQIVRKALPVNVVEALLRGVTKSDEPTAPLHFLFSPKFLNSDRSRTAIYAASTCVPHMQEGALTRTVDLMLTGKRRNLLKITTYKQIVRLLMAQPIPENLSILVREWKRKDLHRDVRITMLQLGLQLLQNDRFGDVAWELLDVAVTIQNTEFLAALLGTPQQAGALGKQAQQLSAKPRIREYLAKLKKTPIPKQYAPRFAKTIVLKLAQEASDDDIKALATFFLQVWYKYGIQDETAQLVHKFLTEFDIKSFSNQILKRRWKEAVVTLFKACSVTRLAKEGVAAKLSYATSFLEDLVKKLLTLPTEERGMRCDLLAIIKETYGLIPSNGIALGFFDKATEEALFAPLKALPHQHFQTMMNRKIAQCPSHDTTQLKALIHEVVAYLAVNPDKNSGLYIAPNQAVVQSMINGTFNNQPISKTKAYVEQIDSMIMQSSLATWVKEPQFTGVPEYLQQLISRLSWARWENLKSTIMAIIDADYCHKQTNSMLPKFVGFGLLSLDKRNTERSTADAIYVEILKHFFSQRPSALSNYWGKILHNEVVEGRGKSAVNQALQQGIGRERLLLHLVALELDTLPSSSTTLTKHELVMPAKKLSEVVIQHYLDTIVYIFSSGGSIEEFLANNLKLMMQVINWKFTTSNNINGASDVAYNIVSRAFSSMMSRRDVTTAIRVNQIKYFIEQLLSDKYIHLKHPNQTETLPDELMHNLHATLAYSVLINYAPQLKVLNKNETPIWHSDLLALLERMTKDRYVVVQQDAIFLKLQD